MLRELFHEDECSTFRGTAGLVATQRCVRRPTNRGIGRSRRVLSDINPYADSLPFMAI
jgi:hypothetical protein